MTGAELRIEQTQTISVEQQQSLQILAYTNQELNEFLTEEYMQNPILECSEDKNAEQISDLEKLYEKGMTYQEHFSRWEDDDTGRKGDIKARDVSGIRDMILDQLNSWDYTEEEWELTGYLIQCLDDRGFFTCTTKEIAEVTHYPEEMVEAQLKILRKLEPGGIFSRNFSECIIAQIEKLGKDDEILTDIINNSLSELLKGNIGQITRKYGITTAKAKEYLHLIGTLNPRPLMSVELDNVQYVVPDVIARYEDGDWKVILNDNWMGEYKYNDYYLRMMRQTKDPELKEYFQQKYKRARMIVESIERRRKTIEDIVKTILEVQEDHFLRNGALKPLTMEEMGERLNIHASTVSRAIKGKYLQYKSPVLIRDLFPQAASSATEASVDHVKARIAEIIRQEDGRKPLSDDKIATMLKAEQMNVSRRTVAKYRISMNIPDSRQRAYL